MNQVQQYLAANDAMKQGTYNFTGDVIDYTLYDRFTLANATLVHRLFQAGVGGAGNRTYADTNVRGALAIPSNNRLIVRAIKIEYQSIAVKTDAVVQNILDMLQETTFNFSITGKDTYGRFSFTELFGIANGFVVNSGGANTIALPFVNRQTGIFPLNIPVVLAELTQFEITVEHHVAPSANLDDDRVKIGLNGILERLN